MPAQLTGGCLCGAIRYTVDQPISELRACHCTHCQKASGTGASINAMLPASSLTITKGKPKLYEDTAQSGRTLNRLFCADCGSPIYSQRANAPNLLVLKVGTLDNPVGMKITANIWTNSARAWTYIDPASDQHPENFTPRT